MQILFYMMIITAIVLAGGCGKSEKNIRTVIIRCEGVPEKTATFELFVNGSKVSSSDERWPYSKFTVALGSGDYIYGKVIARSGIGIAGEIQYSNKQKVGDAKEIIIDTERSRLSAP